MGFDEIITAIENGNLNDAKKGINDKLMSKIQPALKERTEQQAESLILHDAELDLEEETEYEKFFKKALKKFGVSNPAEFKNDEEKKKFFDYIDKNYEAKNESD